MSCSIRGQVTMQETDVKFLTRFFTQQHFPSSCQSSEEEDLTSFQVGFWHIFQAKQPPSSQLIYETSHKTQFDACCCLITESVQVEYCQA